MHKKLINLVLLLEVDMNKGTMIFIQANKMNLKLKERPPNKLKAKI